MPNDQRSNTESEAQIKDLSRAEILESVTEQSSYTNPDRRNFLKGTLGISTAALGFGGVASARGSGASSSAAHDCTSMPPKSQGGIDIEDITLEEVTEEVGLLDPLKGMYGHSTATADVTGNGYLDLFVGTFKSYPHENYQYRGADGAAPDRLLLGGPDGFTVDKSFAEGVPGAHPDSSSSTSGATFADMNNDGELDLVIARAGLRDHEYNETVVLKNDGGEFSKAASLVENKNARTPEVFDYNGDGLLDIFIVNDHYGNDRSSRLYRNKGDFEFVDVTEEVGLPTNITGLSAAAVDFTGNGWLDLLVSGSVRTEDDPSGRRQVQSARLFLNTGGSYREVDASEFEMLTAASSDEAAGIAVADINRNGRLDVVLGTHYHSSLGGEKTQKLFVYLNKGLNEDGVPQFEEVTRAAGIPDLPLDGNSKTTRIPHVQFVDFNNDGWPDILTSLSRGDGTKPVVFRHRGLDDGIPQFATPDGLGNERTPPPNESIWEEAGYNRYWATGAAADYNRDGRMDSFFVEWFPELPSRMFYNEGEVGNWLFVDVDPQSKGIGAIIEVFCPGQLGNPSALIGARPVVANVGYASGVPTQVHFGLGQARTVDLRVTLPYGEGAVERHGVRANQRLHIDAIEPAWKRDRGQGKSRGNGRGRKDN